MIENKFVHDSSHLGTDSAIEICRILIDIFNPKSVVDFGCGLGAFLYTFKQCGVNDVLGINGEWVSLKDIEHFLDKDEYRNSSLIEDINLQKSYDLVLCLEVAEHIDEKYSNTIISNLVNAGKIIVFSAAIPNQQGQNHINEQWPTYWIEKFKKFNYKPLDILRPLIWDNLKVKTWYKQNIIILVPDEFEPNLGRESNHIYNMVHPELFNFRHNYLTNELHENQIYIKNLIYGKMDILFYIKLLIKSILLKFKVYKRPKLG